MGEKINWTIEKCRAALDSLALDREEEIK